MFIASIVIIKAVECLLSCLVYSLFAEHFQWKVMVDLLLVWLLLCRYLSLAVDVLGLRSFQQSSPHNECR